MEQQKEDSYACVFVSLFLPVAMMHL
jgi:hypothetical protein